jgi:hypothetical protein
MTPEPEQIVIDLSTPLSMRSSFRFPLQSDTSRRELLWGAVLLVVLPGIGWFLNMGHRVVVVHRMQHDQPPWPAWHNYGELFRHGLIAAGGMATTICPVSSRPTLRGLSLLFLSASLLARCYWLQQLRSRATCLTIVTSLMPRKSMTRFGHYAGAYKVASRTGMHG